MITINGDGLLIFKDFIVDDNLPKYAESKKARASGNGFYSDSTLYYDSFGATNSMSRVTMKPVPRIKVPLNRKLESIVNTIYDRIQPYHSVEDFFTMVKKEKNKIIEESKHISDFMALIENAKESGQNEYVRMLEVELNNYKLEQKLYELGFKDYITEAQMCAAYKNAERLMRMDWVKNFTRNIPKSVTTIKNKMDDEKIFDNYVILHYDPFRTGSAAKEVDKKDYEKAKEKAKDPILFGVIASSKKLYFIADWEDEYCDLTFEKLMQMTDTEKLEYSQYQMNDGHKVTVFNKEDIS